MENPAEVRRSSSVSGGLNSEPPPLRETLVRLCCETDIPNKSSPDGDADWLTAPAAENTPGGLLAHRTLSPRSPIRRYAEGIDHGREACWQVRCPLPRFVAFVSALMDAGVDFEVVDFRQAVLASAKARGKKPVGVWSTDCTWRTNSCDRTR
jgi:hypothetical protein